MEFAIWSASTVGPWIGLLSIGVLALIPTVYWLSSARSMVKRVKVICPESGKGMKVRLGINIFRNPQKIGKGLDVVRCPHFDGEVTCSKGCLLTARAQQVHRMESERHEKNSTMALS
ncbi:MAG: hypothetical protein HY282_13085 [Nitrospirae bacterium]|nr:hypothetical protein [Candidatus Manganitrophaceae bacterium]